MKSNNSKFILEPYQGSKTRYMCPKCRSKKSFTRFIDTKTNTYLGENVGLCNRKNKCNYSFTPKDYFNNKNSFNNTLRQQLKPVVKPLKSSNIKT